ncbi:MAG TPA: CehA/McbA family metallohydrolase [Longimicrobiales bacterium]|nr:CehA/McbA family metallohydrolase [Longimicrobiales bacterium]
MRRGLVALTLVAACGGDASSEGGATPEAGAGSQDGTPSAAAVRFEPWTPPGDAWLKGNTHTHTTESDGDSPPEEVALWYREHGYDWLVLSDHNVFTDPAALAHLVDDTFFLIPGEEVTSGFDGRPVHVNGLDLPGLVEPRRAASLVATLQANVDAIREVDGIPHVNHPNFQWAFGAEELAQVEGDRLLEIHNGHPSVHNQGGGGTPGLEEVWDALLTGGKRIYGIAVDDAHHFQGEFAPDRANPGRGWVAVRAAERTGRSVVTALEAGHFYASTGVELADVVVGPRRLEIDIAPRGDFRYTTVFIGAGGEILGETIEDPAVYELTRDVGYVRAKVVDSMGYAAWTQPVFVIRDGG